uniref:Uncharacterized protein n=1 Tax=Anguilla anguilla TaxID=7936 RepID=A0A0E9XMN0_ANGAN
MSIRLKKRTV